MGQVAEDVRAFMARELRIRDAGTLAADYPLIKRGTLDSIELMQLVTFLETSYGISVLDTDILPENLGSFDNMEAFVSRKRSVPAEG